LSAAGVSQTVRLNLLTQCGFPAACPLWTIAVTGLGDEEFALGKAKIVAAQRRPQDANGAAGVCPGYDSR
jgi:hypothetical protein